jgi:adenosylcobinamide kinase/adenosylcobinamide-phosphate guanylyltransferase
VTSEPIIEQASLILLLGGVRAGKSARALTLARSLERQRGVLFVATAQAFDEEMRIRIAAHRSERPSHWETLESPIAIAEDIEQRLTQSDAGFDAVVIDCLTLWVSNILLSLADPTAAEAEVGSRVVELLRVAGARATPNTPWIVVSNEVGLGIVPPTPLGRQYRDALGRANQLVAAAANNVSLMVAGIEMQLKP